MSEDEKMNTKAWIDPSECYLSTNPNLKFKRVYFGDEQPSMDFHQTVNVLNNKGLEDVKQQARAEVIEEVLGIIEKWKQPRLTALEAQGSHNEIIYVNILKEELTKLREQK